MKDCTVKIIGWIIIIALIVVFLLELYNDIVIN